MESDTVDVGSIYKLTIKTILKKKMFCLKHFKYRRGKKDGKNDLNFFLYIVLICYSEELKYMANSKVVK